MVFNISNVVNKVAQTFRGIWAAVIAGVDVGGTVRALRTDDQGRIVLSESSVGSSPTVYNVAIVLANTEYSQVIPAGVNCISFQLRTNKVLRFAFVAGKVAGPVAPYATLKAGAVYTCDGLELGAAVTLYLASPDSGRVCEIVVWS